MTRIIDQDNTDFGSRAIHISLGKSDHYGTVVNHVHEIQEEDKEKLVAGEYEEETR